MFTSHTLSNWNGSQDPLAKERSAAAKTSRTANAVGQTMTPTKENKGLDREFTFGEGVLLTPLGQAENARRERVRDDDDISLNSLFDEEASASPSSIRLPLPPATVVPPNQPDAMREGSREPVVSSFKSPVPPPQNRKSEEPRPEVVSVYSEDAEGEDEDEEMEVVEVPSATSPRPQSQRRSASPGSSSLRPTGSLFTPPAKPSKRRLLIDYICPPPFPEGKTEKDYKRLNYARKSGFASSKSNASTSNQKGSRYDRPQGSTVASTTPKSALAKPTPTTYSNLADAFNHANDVNSISLEQGAAPQRPAKKKRKTVKASQPRVVPSDPIYTAGSAQGDDSDVPLSQVKKKRKRTAQTQASANTGPSHKRPALNNMAPPELPRSLLRARDSTPDTICLSEIPFDGSTSYDIWMNAQPCLPSSVVALDENILRLVSNPSPIPYPREEGWSREARRQIQDGSDGEYSIGGHWSDDEELDADLDSPDEELGLESEESFGTPSRQRNERRTPTLEANEIRVIPKGAPTAYHPPTKRREVPPSSQRAPRIVLSPFDLVNETPTVPSQKALGKRRADFQPSPGSGGPHAGSPSRMTVGDAIPYSRPSSHGQSSIQTATVLPSAFRGNQATDVLLSSLSTMDSPQMPFGYGSRPSPLHRTDEPSEDDSLFFGNAVPTSLESSSRTMDSLWHPTAGTDPLVEQQYRPDTINPSLLQQLEEFMPDDALPLTGMGDGEWDLTYPNGEQDARPEEPPSTKWSPSPPSSRSSPASSRSLSPSTSQITKPAFPSKVTAETHSPTIRRERTSPPPSETDYLPELPPYKSDSDDADWEGSDASRGRNDGAKLGRGKRKKTKRMRADYDWHDGSDASDSFVGSRVKFAIEGKKQAATTKKVGPPTSATKLAIGPPRPGTVQWARGNVHEYCHQCRNKTDLLKMACLACALKYCNRCIAVRYPDIKFADEFPIVHPCPKCTKICNCTTCCRARGETYVSSARPKKAKGPALAQLEASNLDMRTKRISKPSARASSSKVVTQVIRTTIVVPSNDEPEFMGPFYALDGSKMQVRVGDVADVQEQALDAPAIEPFRPKRVFIGRVHRSWGFGAQPRITDVEPLRDDELLGSEISGQQQRRGGAASRPKLTVYVGKKPRPPMPRPVFVVPQPEEDSEEEGQDDQEGAARLDGLDDVFSSPLTSLPDTETEGSGDVDGDDGKSYSPESLEDDDLARAIEFTLNKALSSTPAEPISPVAA